MNSRLRVALVAATFAFLLSLHVLVYQNGFASTERIRQFLRNYCHWPGNIKTSSFAEDEYLIGVGKADITGYTIPTLRTRLLSGRYLSWVLTLL